MSTGADTRGRPEVSVHDSLDAVTIRAWASAALTALGDARAEIDALNVFPVPDGDTGTNLYLTAESAAQAVQDVLPDPPPVGTEEPVSYTHLTLPTILLV